MSIKTTTPNKQVPQLPTPQEAEQLWANGLKEISDWFSDDDSSKTDVLTIHNESFTLTNSRYSSLQNRLILEYDSGESIIILEYDRKSSTLNAALWIETRISYWGRNFDIDADQIDIAASDPEAECILQIQYFPPMLGRDETKRYLGLPDKWARLVYPRPEQVSLFAYLIDRLVEYANYSLDKPFDFRSARSYTEKQQTIRNAFLLLRTGLAPDWEKLAKDWDYLLDY